MKKLFSNKGHLMLKYIVNQIAMSLFGLMMSASALAINDNLLLPFGIFGLLFYYFILITFIREDGLKDAIKVDGGRIKIDVFMSLKYCGIAAIPGFLIALLNMFLHIFNNGAIAYEGAAVVLNAVTRILVYGMYNTLDTYFFNNETGILSSYNYLSSNGITYVLYTVFTLAVCFLAYYTGVKQMFVKEEKK